MKNQELNRCARCSRRCGVADLCGECDTIVDREMRARPDCCASCGGLLAGADDLERRECMLCLDDLLGMIEPGDRDYDDVIARHRAARARLALPQPKQPQPSASWMDDEDLPL